MARSDFVSRKVRKEIYRRDNYTCVFCERKVSDEVENSSENLATLDHIYPRSKGGDHSPKNLVTACKWCNDRKRSMDIVEFINKYLLVSLYKVLDRIDRQTTKELQLV